MEPQELVEHRYRAVLEVLDGAPVVEVALRYGVSRQSVHTWRNRYQEHGIEGLKDRSRRPRTSPTRLPADVEALICELRQQHPRWGARRVAYELGRRSVTPLPSRATVHRVLARNGLVDHQQQEHKRKYRRWQRDAPMQLWQMDIVSGVPLADGRECKLVTGIDDHSRFIVVAEVVVRPTGRDVCSAFVAAMQRYGVPTEMLTDNGKQFTGRFTKPRPAEVLFERICRENGIVQRLTKRRSPTTTGKIERFHGTLRREFLDHVGPFASVADAQEAISAWVHSYNHARPHQSLDMAAPVSRFRPSRADTAASLLTAEPSIAAVLPLQSTAPAIETTASPIQRPVSLGAIEFEREVPPCGHFALFHGGQDIWVGPAFAGRTVTVWADDRSIHVTMEGYLLKTFASRTSLEDLARIRDKFSGRPAGPPPAAPALPRHRGRPQLRPGTAVEVDRAVTRDGVVGLGDRDVMLSRTLAGSRVVLRMDEHLLHAISNGRVVKTMPLPIPPGRLPLLKGVRAAAGPLPPGGPARPLTVQRLVNKTGRVMVARQSLLIGYTHRGKTVNVIVEDTHFRVIHNGTELAVFPRTSDKPVTRKAWPSRQPRKPRQESPEDGPSSKS
ncbi:IS481 family transposase [Streptomyces shenzhenensis]|uniref:IS481 family transposase n=1 Tax=Streptomyces shenzhenensis TaxID=943815 RepID=UPI0033D675F6